MNNTDGHCVRRFQSGVSWKGLFAITVWGASFVATRIALESLTPLGLVFLRLLAGTLLLMLVVRVRGGRLLPIRADIPICVLLAILMGLHLLIQSYGLQYTSAINTGWIVGFIPVTIALGAYLFGQQQLKMLGWGGIAVGTAGVLLIMSVKPPDFEHARFGDLVQIVSCLTWTVYTLAVVGPVARNGALTVTVFGMLVATILVTVIALAMGIFVAPLTWHVILAVGFLGLVCSGVGYYMWFVAQSEYGPARIGSLLYIEPFVTLAVATVMLHEPVTLNAIAGGIIVLLGVWLVAKGTPSPAT